MNGIILDPVVGDFIEARFTNSYNYFVFEAQIVKVNRSSVSVKAVKDTVNGWPAGKVFSVPLIGNPRHSVNNGIFRRKEAEV